MMSLTDKRTYRFSPKALNVTMTMYHITRSPVFKQEETNVLFRILTKSLWTCKKIRLYPFYLRRCQP